MYRKAELNKNILNAKGSMLLEVLMSIVILSISITLIIESMTSSLRASKFVSKYTMASFLLENTLFDLIQRKDELNTSYSDQGQAEGPFEDYHYSVLARPADVVSTTSSDSKDKPKGELIAMDIKVDWTSGSKKHDSELTTYILKTEKVDSTNSSAQPLPQSFINILNVNIQGASPFNPSNPNNLFQNN